MIGISVSASDLASAWDGAEKQLAEASTDAMRGATLTMKAALRDQVRAAGLGSKVANTWRGDTYPKTGSALDPAGWAYSNAPAIIDAFSSGATIRPHDGRGYLWIPTRNVPRKPSAGRATNRGRMSPAEVEVRFNQDFIIRRGRRGHKLAFIAKGRGQTPKGRTRRVAKGRLAHGDAAELVLMFTLVPSVRLPKLLDPQAAGNEGAADYVARLDANLR